MQHINYKIEQDPWMHITTDAFVDPVFISELEKFSKQKIEEEHFGQFYFNENTFSKEVLEMFEVYKHNVLTEYEYLFPSFPITRKFKDNRNLDLQSSVCIWPKNYQHPPHCDRQDKLLSVVTYVSPNDNIGTHIHKEALGPIVKTVDWKVGNTLIFAGYNNLTWHSYQSNDQPRVSLNSFVINKDIAEFIKTLKEFGKIRA